MPETTNKIQNLNSEQVVVKKAVSVKENKNAINDTKNIIKKNNSNTLKEINNEEKRQDLLLDKEALKKFRAFVNSKTSLDNVSQYIKPIALLDYYAPLVKVRLFYPRKNNGKYETVDLFNSEFLTSLPNSGDQVLQINNYIESLSLVAEGGSDIKFTIKIVDNTLDFSDLILMRFSKEFSNNIFVEIEYGWSNKEKKALAKWNNEKKPVFFTNGFVGILNTLEIDENLENRRIITLAGIRTDNLPGELSTVLPYNELGPYPMITYQFIKFLQLDANQMKKIVQLASGYNADEPDKGIQKDKFNRIKPGVNSVIRGQEEKLINLIEKFHKAVIDLKKSISEDDPRYKFLNSIGSNSILTAKQVENYYLTKEFKQIIQSKDSFGDLTEELMRRFTTIIRDIRIHPFEALKYFVSILNSKLAEYKKNIFDQNVPGIIINDFVGVLDKNLSSFEQDKFDLIPRDSGEIGSLVGWAGWDKLRLDQIYDSNEALRMVGILPSDIELTPTTSWGSLLNMCAQKCLVYTEAFDLDQDGEVKIDPRTNMPKKLSQEEINKRGKAKDPSFKPIVETSFDKKTKEVAFKLAKNFRKTSPMKITCLLTNQTQALDMLEGITLLNKAKAEQSFRSMSELDNYEVKSQTNLSDAKSSRANLEEQAYKTNEKIKEQIKLASKSDFFYVINIYNDRQADLFGINFAKNNILQGFSYRMHTQNEYAYNFNPGLPSTKLINFPDVLSFKPNLSNALQYLQNIISASQNLVVQVPDGIASRAFITSSAKKAIEKALALKKEKQSQLISEQTKTKGKELKKITEEIEKLTKEIETDENYLKSSILENESERAIYNNPIYLNLNVPLSAIYGNSKNNNDIGILKTNIVNFRKRFMASAASNYEATLEIFGDPSFNDINNFGTGLVYIKVYNPDGSDSMHTGIYILKGVTHELQSGMFKTVLSLQRNPKIDNPELMQDLENIIYADALTKEEAWNRIIDKINLQDFAKQKDAEGNPLIVDSATTLLNTQKLADAADKVNKTKTELDLAIAKERAKLSGLEQTTNIEAKKLELNKAKEDKKATEELFVSKVKTIVSSATPTY